MQVGYVESTLCKCFGFKHFIFRSAYVGLSITLEILEILNLGKSKPRHDLVGVSDRGGMRGDVDSMLQRHRPDAK